MQQNSVLKNTINLVTLLALLLNYGCKSEEKPSPRPNIILIVADDLGWGDLSCYGNTFIETAHLDKLSEQGLRFTNAYAAGPLCSPTRASIVTGINPARLNLTEHIHGHHPTPPSQQLVTPKTAQGLPLDASTIGEALQKVGYTTGHIGKWHLGGGKFSPANRGYDLAFGGSWAGLPGSFFYPFFNGDAYPELKENSKEGDYLTDKLTDKALSFIVDNREIPFFLALNFYAPHVPIEGKPELVEKYRNKRGDEPDSLLPNVHYAAMVEAIDQNVGRILNQLEKIDLSQRTIVLFTSDNGGLHVREVPAFDKHTPPTTNTPLKDGKGYLHEGGIRIPLIIRNPFSAVKGKEINTPVITDDLFNTIMAMVGSGATTEDGLDLTPLLYGKAIKERNLYWHFPHYSPQSGLPGSIVRSGKYKLITWYETGEMALYDLEKDLGERDNLLEENPDLVEEMQHALDLWLKKVNAKMPEKNPEFKP